MFEELDVPSPSELKDALSTIAAAGAHTRVGLTPRTGKRIWRYDPATTVSVHRLPDVVVNGGTAEVLEHIRRQPGVRDPVEVFVSRRLIAFCADHGIGDARFVLDLLSSLLALTRGRASPWVTNDDTPLALARALVRTFGIHPARASAAWRYAADMRSACAVTRNVRDGGESVAWSPAFAVAVAHVNADAESAVTEWRRANAEDAGSAAVWLYIVRRALRTAGLQMTDTVLVAFDCHRYLPKRFTFNSNFIVGLEFPFAEDETLAGLSTRLREATVAAVPLAAIGAVSARNLLRAGRRPPMPASRNVAAPASVFYTDMGNITSLDDMPWCDRARQSFTGLPDAAYPDDLTILNTRIGSTRNISISFHDNVFDRRIIDRAVDHLKDPIRLLPPNAPPRL